jgi:5-methylcytosine-specific restriction endonuclease McrA
LNAIREICDRIQGKAPKGAKRSSKWRSTRKRFMARADGCSICSRKRRIEAHHVIPFHLAPDLELEFSNLIALCRRCHLFVGHLGAWQRINLVVESDAAHWRAKMREGAR